MSEAVVPDTARSPVSGAENGNLDILMSVREVTKIFQDGDRKVEVLQEINLDIEPAKILAIMGASGVGKSTLLHILGLLDRPTGGQIVYRSKELTSLDGRERAELRTREFGFVFQMFHLFPDLDAQENAMLPALIGPGWIGRQMSRSRAKQRSAELLDQLGLSDRLGHRPSQLSGGEKQRVAIARALMNTPRIVFCDEPTGNLDPATSDEIFRLILNLNRENQQTFVLATHDPVLAAKAHSVFRLEPTGLVPVTLADEQDTADDRQN